MPLILAVGYLVKLLGYSFACFVFCVCVHLYGQLLVPLAFMSYGTLLFCL